MNIIRSTIMNANNRDGITGEEIKEITGMIKELRTNINKRIKTVK